MSQCPFRFFQAVSQVVERVAHYLPHGVYWGSTGAESHWKEAPKYLL